MGQCCSDSSYDNCDDRFPEQTTSPNIPCTNCSIYQCMKGLDICRYCVCKHFRCGNLVCPEQKGQKNARCAIHARICEYGDVFECSNKVFNQDYYYCDQHKCNYSGCQNMRYSRVGYGVYPYCHRHRCKDSECKKAVFSKGSDACEDHGCFRHPKRLAVRQGMCGVCVEIIKMSS